MRAFWSGAAGSLLIFCFRMLVLVYCGAWAANCRLCSFVAFVLLCNRMSCQPPAVTQVLNESDRLARTEKLCAKCAGNAKGVAVSPEELPSKVLAGALLLEASIAAGSGEAKYADMKAKLKHVVWKQEKYVQKDREGSPVSVMMFIGGCPRGLYSISLFRFPILAFPVAQ